MLLSTILFDFLAAIAAASAIGMVTRRNPLHAAILLLATLLAAAGIFLQLQAEYAFAVQLLLFAGGVVLLFVLAVMLLHPDALRQRTPFNWKAFSISALALVFAIQVLALLWGRHDATMWPAVTSLPPNNTGAIGNALFRNDLLPFELASIPLLATIIGVVALAKRRTE
jgi:NADH-quinone oxidoreductase subunit J